MYYFITQDVHFAYLTMLNSIYKKRDLLKYSYSYTETFVLLLPHKFN